MKLSRAYSRQVFLNCPFDEGYRPLFEAIIFTVLHCGFALRCTRECEDSGEPRIAKIVDLIRKSQFGIHDISRVELDAANSLPRFNMPLELGLFLGAKAFSEESKHKDKRCLILDTEPYRYQKFVSDISGQDIRAHSGDPMKVLSIVRDWLRNVSRRELPGSKAVVASYREFQKDLPELLGNLGVGHLDMPFADFVNLTVEWLKIRQVPVPSRK